MSNELIGKEFGISVDTVRRSMRKAMNGALVQKFEDEMLKNLVPEAMATARQALKEGNATVALEILKGTGILKKVRDVSHESDNPNEESLEAYIRIKRQKSGDQSARTNLSSASAPTFPSSGPEPFIDDQDPEESETDVFQADGFSSLSPVAGVIREGPLVTQEGQLVRNEDEDDGA